MCFVSSGCAWLVTYGWDIYKHLQFVRSSQLTEELSCQYHSKNGTASCSARRLRLYVPNTRLHRLCNGTWIFANVPNGEMQMKSQVNCNGYLRVSRFFTCSTRTQVQLQNRETSHGHTVRVTFVRTVCVASAAADLFKTNRVAYHEQQGWSWNK